MRLNACLYVVIACLAVAIICSRVPAPNPRLVAYPCMQPRAAAITQTPSTQTTSAASRPSFQYDSYDAAIVAAICAVADGTDRIDAGGLDHLKALLDKHPDLVNAHRVLSPQRKPSAYEDWPPLNLAAWNGNEPAVALLLERGADVNSTEDYGCTPLHRAAMMGYLPVVKLLVEHGANIHAKTQARPQMTSNDFPNAPGPGLGAGPPTILPAVPAQTALDLAQQWKHDDVAEYLQSISK